MSDEKNTDTEKWQIDSLEEEDDIIELTEEIEPSPPAKHPQQDRLDEIVIGLDDTVLPPEGEEIQELTDAALEEVDFDELVPLDETDGDTLDSGEETLPALDEEVHDLFGKAADEVHDLFGEAADKDEFEELETLLAEAREATPTDLEEVETIEEVVDLDDDPLPLVEDMAQGETAEVSLEGLLPEDDGDHIPIADMETEVDIDEVTDLEPIVPETIPEAEPLSKNDADMARYEKMTSGRADPVPPPGDDIIEIAEFDQQYFDDAPAHDEADLLPTTEDADEDDFLELIDVEEAEDESADLDDEIIHFDQDAVESSEPELDDLLSDPDHEEPELEPSADQEKGPSPDLSSRRMAEAAATALASEFENGIEAESPPAFFESSPAEEAGGRMEADGESRIDGAESAGPEVIPAAISSAQIEAAVAHIIERDYAGEIEDMVATAIEKVVRLEIERIKARLFEDDLE
jgi:hypothetical protein